MASAISGSGGSSTFTAGTGTATYKAEGVIQSNVTSTGNGADTTEDTLWTYTLPANTLTTDGQCLRITVLYQTAANTDVKVGKLYFGSTVLMTRSNADNNVKLQFNAVVQRTSATTQNAFANVFIGGVGSSYGGTVPSETLSGTIVIKVTGQDTTASTANSIVFKGVTVEVMP